MMIITIMIGIKIIVAFSPALCEVDCASGMMMVVNVLVVNVAVVPVDVVVVVATGTTQNNRTNDRDERLC